MVRTRNRAGNSGGAGPCHHQPSHHNEAHHGEHTEPSVHLRVKPDQRQQLNKSRAHIAVASSNAERIEAAHRELKMPDDKLAYMT